VQFKKDECACQDNSPISFIQNNKMKNSIKKSFMTEEELHAAYSLLLQKSNSLLRNILIL